MSAAGLWVMAAVMATATVSGSMPGGLNPVSVNDAGVVNASLAAAEAYNRGSNDMYSSRVSRVVEAQTQVVAGILYHLKVELKTTTCRKLQGASTQSASCPFHQTAKKRLCEFKVWERVWVGPPKVTVGTCTLVTE
ncbi:cystatin-like [Leucoraja erinacea]|uniref:cystatin-like n=1 Tax=Leucoraja erinaceus TaxID=7782 RepID=UPI002457FC23|nr:cystatin-like [Leucoraja erinacea]